MIYLNWETIAHDTPFRQLWDVAGDQQAVDLVRDNPDAQEASKALLSYAIGKATTDNVTVLVVRFKKGSERNVSPPSV